MSGLNEEVKRMADNFGLKIGVEGEKEFKKALSDINQSFKVLGSEMNLVSSQFEKQDNSEKLDCCAECGKALIKIPLELMKRLHPLCVKYSTVLSLEILLAQSAEI